MSKILQIAVREFVATVFTRAYLIGLLVLPAMILLGVAVGPRLFGSQAFPVAGQVAVVDLSGAVLPQLRAALAAGTPAAELADMIRQVRAGTAGGNVAEALGMAPDLTLIERSPSSDVEREKEWLLGEEQDDPRVALAVIHADAATPVAGGTELGSYDLYVPPGQDTRVEIAVHQAIREAIISARIAARGLDRAAINDLMTVPRVQSVTVSQDGERATVGGATLILPFAFMFLLIMSVMGSGQGLLTTMIEEKSSRVIEVLLSAVSPWQLMGGKLLGHMAISLLGMGLYIALGMLALTSFSLFGLIEPHLIVYLFLFFLIGFFTIGSLMMAAGAAVNDMREAQSLMMPMMLMMILPWVLWIPITRAPSSPLAVVVSLVPPVNTFGMLLRMASTEPPPWWQVWLSIGIGALGVVGATWFAAKVFRIGLLMFGKPPNLRTLLRWVRAA